MRLRCPDRARQAGKTFCCAVHDTYGDGEGEGERAAPVEDSDVRIHNVMAARKVWQGMFSAVCDTVYRILYVGRICLIRWDRACVGAGPVFNTSAGIDVTINFHNITRLDKNRIRDSCITMTGQT